VQLKVAETPGALPVTVASGLRRWFQVELPAGATTWFLAGLAVRTPRIHDPDGTVRDVDSRGGPAELPAVGTRISLPQDGDRTIVLDLTAAAKGSSWHFIRSRNGWQVLLQLPAASSMTTAAVDLRIWGLPRDEVQLIRGLKAN
jgi:hypothetical protein